jgi:hypothetical protein
MDGASPVPWRVPTNMNLSISIPTPTAPDPTPASSSLAGLASDNAPKDDGSQDSFSQLLPKQSPDNSGKDPQQQGNSTKPTKAQEEAAAALSASLLATVQQHLAPTVPADLVPAGGSAAAEAAAAGKVQASAAATFATPASAILTAATPLVAPGEAAAKAGAPAAKTPPPSPPTAASVPEVPASAASAVPVTAATLPGSGALPLTGQTAQAAAIGGEKIAATSVKPAATAAAPTQAAAKKFLSNGDKQVTDSSESVGTPVAKVTSAMPTLNNPERNSTAQVPFQVASVAAPTTGASSTQAPAQAEVTGSAKGAVEAAMTAAEMLTSGAAQNSMNMQFSMGGADLNLRVEMRNGEVQATFTTNSAQLRSDLAHVWQTTAAGNSQSSLHQIQPVFTASGSGSTLSSGEYAQQQGRGQNAGSEPRFSTSGGSSSSGYAQTHEEESAEAAPAAAAAGSQYLQTFA